MLKTQPILFITLLLIANIGWSQENHLYTAKYEGRISGISVKLTRKLIKKSANRYESSSKASNFLGSIKELSRFYIEDNEIRVTFYEHRKKALGLSKAEQVQFNWESMTAQYNNREKPRKNKLHKLAPNILDNTIYQLQLQRDCFNKIDDTKVTFIKGDQIKTRHFVFDKKEEINIGKKKYNSVKYQRINYDDLKKTNIWFIPKLNCQIARIQHIEEDGGISELKLVSYKSTSSLVQEIYQIPVINNYL